MSVFGRFYRVMTFGQSHSSRTNQCCVVEGFPSNFQLDLSLIQRQLNRRRPGQSLLTTARDEKDQLTCISGIENNTTLGSPLTFIVANQNIRKKDYSSFSHIPRPGHADFTYLKKYGIKAESGGGRSSARETVARVIAGALAKQYLETKGITISAWVKQINTISVPSLINESLIESQIQNREIQILGEVRELSNSQIWAPVQDFEQIRTADIKMSEGLRRLRENGSHQQHTGVRVSNTRCPHPPTSVQMYKAIQQAQKEQNSLGGIVQGCIYGLPVGLGEPTFDKFPAVMAHAMLSLPATKGFQFGSGFRCAEMHGNEHNDKFDQNLKLTTNNSGGTLGGITSGSTFEFRVAFKPVSSIAHPQKTHDFKGNPVTLVSQGRHDPCVLPRAPPIVDNMAAMVVMDLLLAHNMHS